MTDMFRLTPLQEGMLFESVVSDRLWVNLEQVVCHLEDEPVDAAAMQLAWQSATDAIPALRGVIDWHRSDGPVQSHHPVAPVHVDIHDWSTQADPDTSLAQWLARDRETGVDPSVFPGFRVALFQLGPRRGVLVWTFLHTLLDGRSILHVLEEVFRRYECFLAARPLPGSHANPDAFRAHCLALQDMSHAEGSAYFAGLLDGYDGSFGIADKTRDPVRKAISDHDLDEHETRALAELAREAGVSVGTVVQAAWGLVLGRWSDRGDAVFGTTIAGRHLVAGAGEGLGCFINTVPARVRIGGQQELGTLLTRLRRDQIGLRPHEQTPLSEIKRLSEVPRDKPLFDSMVMFERGSMQDLLHRRGGNWPGRRVEFLEEGAMPVTLAVYHDPRLLLRLEYDPAQVPDGARIANYLPRLLRSMIAGGTSAPLSRLDMLGQTETEHLPALSRPDPEVHHGPDCCLTLFDRAARSGPDRIAVSQPGAGSLTYAELDARANGLAARMRHGGVAEGDMVALCLSRSADFIVAQIAAWKAGAAFVPMDPAYPPAVLQGMCEDSGTVLAVIDETAPPLPCETLPVAPDTGVHDTGVNPPGIDRSPERAAYVIFTSGSTGRPKGVVVSHASLAAHHAAISRRYGLSRADKVLQFASLSFDVSLEEIVPTLLNGAELVLRTADMAGSFRTFLDRVAELALSVLNLPTAFWVALTEEMDATGARLPDSVRLVVVGGERVPAPALRRWRGMHPELRWINGYGPTEATITCTTYEAGDNLPCGDAIPIGTPVSHARALVLASDRSPSPEGAVGELWVAGAAVAQGYIGRPDLTAERFVAAPDSLGGGRMYRTGDMVRWRGDGQLAYLGRGDRQIKLRGFRIEPDEIEMKLEAMAQVEHAVVAVDQPDSDQARLVAWVSLVGAAPEDLASCVEQAFQPHMRPLLVPVQDWPKTPGGKIDLKRLPLPPRAGADRPQEEPADEDTNRVAAVFRKVLGIRRAGPDASFFDLGGHSLRVLRLIGQLERQFGTRLAPATVMASPTPRGLARALRETSGGADPLVVLPIQPEGAQPPIYGIHVIGEEGKFFRPLADVLGPDQPVFGLTVGLLSEETPVGIEDTAQFYFEQIQTHHPHGPLSLAAVSLGSYVALELAQRLVSAGRDVLVLALFDAEGPAGRQSQRGLRKLLTHVRQVRRQGAGYLGAIVSTKAGDLRHKAEMLRRKLTLRTEDAASPVLTIGQFVAANDLARRAYRPLPYSRPITVFRASANHFDSPEGIENGLGWKPIARGGLDVIDVPGDHLSILEHPNVEQLGRELAVAIRRAAQDPET